jgi:hypothetical protein
MVYHSPYISICQSSGYGKSRLLKEFSRKNPVLYLSLADGSSTAYPRQTKTAMELVFQSGTHGVINQRALLCAVLETVKHFNKRKDSPPFDELEKGNIWRDKCTVAMNGFKGKTDDKLIET